MKKISDFRREWENRFPNLDSPWTHWWIEGDDKFIGLLPLNKLSSAIDLVQDSCLKYISIKVYRAKYELNGNVSYNNHKNWVISNSDNDGILYAIKSEEKYLNMKIEDILKLGKY